VNLNTSKDASDFGWIVTTISKVLYTINLNLKLCIC